MPIAKIPAQIAAQLKRHKEHCTYEIREITPALAQEWVAKSETYETMAQWQRSRLAEKVAVYARSVGSDSWALNGDAILFDTEGNLIDGLARLLACIEADKSFTTIVAYGVPHEAVQTLGGHLRRTASDILDINNEPFPRAIAHAWPIIVPYLNAIDRRHYSKANILPTSPPEMLALTDRYPAIRESARIASESRASRVMGDGVAVAIHFIVSLASPEKADAFMRIVGDPSIDERSAAATLSHRLTNLKKSAQKYRLALTAKAWNRFYEDKPIGASGLVFAGKVEGETLGQEAFPVLAGVPLTARIDMTGIARTLPERRFDPLQQVDDPNPPSMDIVYVPWETAAEYLTRNGPIGTEHNRKLRPKHVSRLARDMKTPRWKLNMQALKFGRSGRLIDGQHRCSAAVESKTGFITFVVRGLDDSVFSTYDGGESKSLGRIMKEAGVPTPTALAAALILLHKVLTNTSITLTVGEGYAYAAEHPGLADHIAFAYRKSLKQMLPSSVITVLSYLFSQKDPLAAKRFFADLATGADLSPQDPMLRLRNALMAPKLKSQFPLSDQKAKVAIQTWNARRAGKTVRGFSTSDGFPEVQ